MEIINTEKISSILSIDYNVVRHISAIAYKEQITTDDVVGFGQGVSSIIESYDISSQIGLGNYIHKNDVRETLALSTLQSICGKNIVVSDGKLSANEGRMYKAGSGLSLDSETGTFSTSAEYTTYNNVLTSLSVDGYVTTDENERVWIENMINGNISGYSDISVIKIPISSYEEKVVNNTLSDNTLYVIDADYIEAYGQQICSLTMGDTEETKYEGIATTKPYVDEKITNIKDAIKTTVSNISNEIFAKELNDIEIIDIVNSLSILCESLKQI